MRHSLAFMLAFALTAPAAWAQAPGPDGFLASLLIAGPTPRSGLALSHPDQPMVAAYDVALAALWLLDRGRTTDSGRLLAGLAALQRPDGGLPFSYRLPAPFPADPTRPGYVRAGANAWAAYAAGRWLTAAPDLASTRALRETVTGLAIRSTAWLLDRRVQRAGDPRDGLVTGGEGRYVYSVVGGQLTERFEPGEVAWVSAEHNIDAWFALRAMAKATGDWTYREAAKELGQALVARLWDEQRGQFHQGALSAPDPTNALDCASWGATFLAVWGDPGRARRSLEAAGRYAARDAASGATGYRPYRGRPLIESRAAYDFHKSSLPPGDWSAVEAVWPEGTAGVALAQLRLGDAAGARRTLGGLAPLRDAAGGLPGLTLAIPTEFTTSPALAGTVWEAIVRSEAEGRAGALKLWYD